MQGIPEQRALYITAYWAAANSSVCVCVCARAHALAYTIAY
jgi:hypothetical protein